MAVFVACQSGVMEVGVLVGNLLFLALHNDSLSDQIVAHLNEAFIQGAEFQLRE